MRQDHLDSGDSLLRAAQIVKSRTKYVTAKDKAFLVKDNILPDKAKAWKLFGNAGKMQKQSYFH